MRLSEEAARILHELYYYDDVDFKILGVGFKHLPERPKKTLYGWAKVCSVYNNTTKRILQELVNENVLVSEGKDDEGMYNVYSVDYSLVKDIALKSPLGDIATKGNRVW